MEHEIQQDFDCSRFTAVSPLSKESIVEIAELLKGSFPETIACSDEPLLSLRYHNVESSYLLSEFRKNYSKRSPYVEVGISIYADCPQSLVFIFHLSTRYCFLNMRSNALTLAELEDLRDVISERISTILDHAQFIDVSEDADHLETLYSKVMTLPVVDASGNVLNKPENRKQNTDKADAGNGAKKKRIYKSGLFWTILGVILTACFFVIQYVYPPGH